MRETKLKSSKGITLIALVITIIVLLILAGVAISMLSGDNGMLKQAANAKTEQEIAQKKEETALTDMEVITDFKTSGKNIKYKFKNGYLTNVTLGELIGDITDKLPTGYTLVGNADEIAKTGTEMKKGEQTVGRVVIFGDIDEDGVFLPNDGTDIARIVDKFDGYKDYQIVAADLNHDNILDANDVKLFGNIMAGNIPKEEKEEIQDAYASNVESLKIISKLEYQKNIVDNLLPEEFRNEYDIFYDDADERFALKLPSNQQITAIEILNKLGEGYER